MANNYINVPRPGSGSGGSGLTNPLTSDLNVGGFDITGVVDISLSNSSVLSFGSTAKLVASSGLGLQIKDTGGSPGEAVLAGDIGLGLYSDETGIASVVMSPASGGSVSIAGSFNSVPFAQFDSSANPGETRMLLYDADAGILSRVKVSANNAATGITGRVLYVDNTP